MFVLEPPQYEDLIANCWIEETGCWAWQGPVDAQGFGVVTILGYELHVHRAVWTYLNPTKPATIDFHMTCRNNTCVNPEHMSNPGKPVRIPVSEVHNPFYVPGKRPEEEEIITMREEHSKGRSFKNIYMTSPYSSEVIRKILIGETYTKIAGPIAHKVV
jgi:hypothetical protein